MRLIFSFILFSLATSLFPQKNICGDYIVPEFEGTDVYKRLSLKCDSTFEFVHIHNFHDKKTGKWRVDSDTLVLFSCEHLIFKIDTLSGQEFITGTKDSIEIIFINKFNKKPEPQLFVINNQCSPDERMQPFLKYVLPKQNIEFIFIPDRYQLYEVKNKKADKSSLKLFHCECLSGQG